MWGSDAHLGATWLQGGDPIPKGVLPFVERTLFFWLPDSAPMLS
jgi:hypothetical protein